MKKNFGILENNIRLKVTARSLWMDCGHGEGELEIRNQGRFEQSRFSQETVAQGQQTPRIGESRSKLRFTQEVSSAGCTLASDSTPPFFSQEKSTSEIEKAALSLAERTQTRLQALFRDSKSSVASSEVPTRKLIK